IVYWLVAHTRRLVSATLGTLHDRDLREDPWTLTRSVYLKALGLVMFLAVISYWSQIQALNGADGILPAQDLVERVQHTAETRDWSAWETFEAMPSLYALSPTDGTLHGLAGMAALGALLLMLGLVPGPALALVLLGWASIVAVGGTFTGYQWDIFNVEVCVASLFVAPWKLRPKCTRGRRATIAGRWLLRVILFKFILLNGIVKWQSGDAPWEELTALQYHYWTQPIPHAVSWYAHHLPAWLHEASVVGMFVVELILPFFIFGTRRMRQLACLGIASLMVA
ncbi:MAG: lipase maturation factor family protein, partial [Myxococcota bacterium]|nr:lipase maturation factor family protein [Myxococcota bacterium]